MTGASGCKSLFGRCTCLQQGLCSFVPCQLRTCLGFTADGAASHLRSLEPFALNNQSLLECALSLKVPRPQLCGSGASDTKRDPLRFRTARAHHAAPRTCCRNRRSAFALWLSESLTQLSGFLEGALDPETSRKACCSSGKAGGRGI